jgi:hypothetical protein
LTALEPWEDKTTADGARALAERRRHPRYEVLPLEGIEAAVRAHAAQEVTASPRRGRGATLELSERLAREGYAVVPHLSARLVRDDLTRGSGLRGLADRIAALGGQLVVDSPQGAGTTIRATIPCGR